MLIIRRHVVVEAPIEFGAFALLAAVGAVLSVADSPHAFASWAQAAVALVLGVLTATTYRAFVRDGDVVTIRRVGARTRLTAQRLAVGIEVDGEWSTLFLADGRHKHEVTRFGWLTRRRADRYVSRVSEALAIPNTDETSAATVAGEYEIATQSFDVQEGAWRTAAPWFLGIALVVVGVASAFAALSVLR